jgi:hypothetical protein
MHGAIFVTIEIQNRTCIIDTFCRVNRKFLVSSIMISYVIFPGGTWRLQVPFFSIKFFSHVQLYILLLLRFGRTFHFLHMDFLRKCLFLYNYDVNKSINIFHLGDYCSYMCDVYIVTSGAVVSSDTACIYNGQLITRELTIMVLI